MTMYQCSIIANPAGNAWEFAKEIYEKLNKKANGGKYELNEVNIKTFRDGEIMPRIKENIRRKNCFFIHDSSLPPSKWLLQLNLINETMKNSSAQEITNVLPYLKFARQDRKDQSRVPISSRAIAKSIGRYADKVLTIDVHNPSIAGSYDIPFDNLYSFTTVIDYLNKKYPGFFENMVVMSPDVGGAKRARSFAKRAGVKKIVIGDKNREEDGEVESIQIIGDVKGKNVLMVDDIIDSGNTMIQSCEACRKQGAKKVYAYVTHGLFTEGIDKLTKCFDMLIVGDTVLSPEMKMRDDLVVISFADLFAESIYRINEGKSLSELFD
jgi:ribose-phosphate pyrophosphokinase